MGLQLYGLQGTIPPDIGNLTALTSLDLWSTSLSGELPSRISALTQLARLRVSGLQVPLPSTLGLMTTLTYLELSGFHFTGATIPSELAALTALTTLGLSSSSLSGFIPSLLGKLTALRQLYLYGNSLSGQLPLSLSALTSMHNLDIYNNPCLYGPVVSIGDAITSYSTYGTALGSPYPPAGCPNDTRSPSLSPPPASAPPPPYPASDRAAMLAINASW